MRIVRQTEKELVVEESSLWITLLLAVASLPLFYAATIAGQRSNLFMAFFLLGCSVVWLRRSIFVFDAGQEAVRWKRLNLFKSSSGVIPFSEITGLMTETTCGGSAASRTYRLTIATTHGCIPMSDSYGPGRRIYEKLQGEILHFLRAAPGATSLPADTGLDSSIRGLLAQGRKVDAIQLVRSAERLDLTAAKQRVDRIAAGMTQQRRG